MNFQRTIGPAGLIFAGISSVIGSGWLFGPLFAAQIAGPAAIISWVVGGLLMTIIALTFAELGTAFPLAGGMIQFAQRSHGPLISFMVGWMVWLSSVAVAPVETMSIIQYANLYLPFLMHKVDQTYVLSGLGILASAIIMMIMVILNYFGAKFFSRANIIVTLIKLIVPIATVILLLTHDFHADNFTAHGFFANGWHGVFAALPLAGVIYSFIGSNTVLQLAGETKNPKFSIPLALIGSMLFCIVLYLLIQVAFIGAIPMSSLINGWSKLHYPGDSGPFAGIMISIGLYWFAMIIYADALISPFGTGFVFTATTARVSYGLSEIKFFPAKLKQLTNRGIPVYSIFVNYFVGLLLFLPFPIWQKLVSFIVSCFIVSYIIGPISLIALRKTHPHIERPFKLPFASTIALIAFYICNLLIFWSGWQTVSKMMIALLFGFALYIFYCYREPDHKWSAHFKTSWWVFPYFILLSFISYLGSFGGGINRLTFGYDFIVIALLTILIYWWIIKSVQISKIIKNKLE